VAIFAAYARALGFEFVFDDRGQIAENPLVQSWGFAGRYFTEHVWAHMFPDVPGNYYRPLFMLWLMVHYMLFGLAAFWWHLTTILTHLAATWIVYVVARQLLEDRFTAAAAAILFGLHPVHVESVAWVSAVSEPLFTLLLLGALSSYIRMRRGPGTRQRLWLCGSIVLYALALLTKEPAVILPVLVACYEWLLGPANDTPQEGRFGRRVRAACRSVLPYLVVTAFYVVARTIVLDGFGHTVVRLPLRVVLLTLPSVLWFYVQHLVWPVGLAGFYDVPYIKQFTTQAVGLPAVGLAVVAAGLSWWAWHSRRAAFSVICLVLPILPLLNLRLLPHSEIAHDRYLYFPSVGLCFLLALALRRLPEAGPRLFGQPVLQIGLLGTVASVMGAGVYLQSTHWSDDISFYQRGVESAPENEIARSNLAAVLFERGRYAEGIYLYEEVLARAPDSWQAHYSVGYGHYGLNHNAVAERHLTRSIELGGDTSSQFLYRGLTRLRLGRSEEALADIQHAIEIGPAPGYYFALGSTLQTMDRLREAREAFQRELAIDPQQGMAKLQIDQIDAQLRKRQAAGSSSSGAPAKHRSLRSK
jgi:tetratricopeptide (TPR) repeat protein